jgi:hypothetical protein
MKKVLSLVLALGLAFALYACGGGSSSGSSLPPFTGTTTVAAISNTSIAQAIVDSVASAPSHINNGVDEMLSFFDLFETPGVVTMTTSTTGVINGCGGGGSAAITGLNQTANGGSGTFTFTNFVPYDQSDTTGATCMTGVTINSGSFYVSMTENWSWDAGCGCDTGSASGYISVTDVQIQKTADGSDRTYRGTVNFSESATTTTRSDNITVNAKFTDNTIAAPNETMLANYKENSTGTQGTNTDTVTISGSVYVPDQGKVTVAGTLTVTSGVPSGTLTITGGSGIVITADVGAGTWACDLDGNGDTLGAGETGAFTLTPRY